MKSNIDGNSAIPSFRYLFGPVPSRRFGRSLGVDLVPYKTCSFNCSFCEVGLTTSHTLRRKEYVPTEAVLEELNVWAAQGRMVDFLTLAGSGEPTLHIRFGDILEHINRLGMGRSAILTNSSLLFLPAVRTAAARADVVKATLSAWDATSFAAVARPHPALRFEQVIAGLRQFRQEFAGAIWLEVFIVPGVNEQPEQIKKIAAIARTISPNRIQLNTAVRPTAEGSVFQSSEQSLHELARLFEPAAEVIARFASGTQAWETSPQSVLAMLERRPCTADDIMASFSLSRTDCERILTELTRSGRVHVEERGNIMFYQGKSDWEQRLDNSQG